MLLLCTMYLCLFFFWPFHMYCKKLFVYLFPRPEHELLESRTILFAFPSLAHSSHHVTHNRYSINVLCVNKTFKNIYETELIMNHRNLPLSCFLSFSISSFKFLISKSLLAVRGPSAVEYCRAWTVCVDSLKKKE